MKTRIVKRPTKSMKVEKNRKQYVVTGWYSGPLEDMHDDCGGDYTLRKDNQDKIELCSDAMRGECVEEGICELYKSLIFKGGSKGVRTFLNVKKKYGPPTARMYEKVDRICAKTFDRCRRVKVVVSEEE